MEFDPLKVDGGQDAAAALLRWTRIAEPGAVSLPGPQPFESVRVSDVAGQLASPGAKIGFVRRINVPVRHRMLSPNTTPLESTALLRMKMTLPVVFTPSTFKVTAWASMLPEAALLAPDEPR